MPCIFRSHSIPSHPIHPSHPHPLFSIFYFLFSTVSLGPFFWSGLVRSSTNDRTGERAKNVSHRKTKNEKRKMKNEKRKTKYLFISFFFFLKFFFPLFPMPFVNSLKFISFHHFNSIFTRFSLHCIFAAPHCTAFHFAAFIIFSFCFAALHCTALHCTALHFTTPLDSLSNKIGIGKKKEFWN